MTYVRREVSFAPDGDQTLSDYARAVALMRKRDSDPKDPTSWAYQAAIHGTASKPAQTLWNECQRGSWYFLAWHRMYVYYFEQIARAAVVATGGPADWALPYWNYGRNGEYAAMPPAFRKPTLPNGEPNPLYVEQRNPRINAGERMPERAISATEALARPSFSGRNEFGGGPAPPGRFGGEPGKLELMPHNDVHNAIGGWMSAIESAALDPIFWLHHANIDRLWAVWNGMGRVNPDDEAWTMQTYRFFDVNGSLMSKTCGEVGKTVDDLDYTYDQLAPETGDARPAAAEPAPEIVGASESPLRLIGRPARIPIPIDSRARSAFDGEVTPRHIYLHVQDIEGERNPSTIYGVYINLPKNATFAQEESHYVGNVSFFGINRAPAERDEEHSHGLRVTIDITERLHALAARGEWDEDQLHVSFRPLGLVPLDAPPEAAAAGMRSTGPEATDESPVSIGRVTLSYE
jgi:tyrosinase